MRENLHSRSNLEKESEKQVCLSFKGELFTFIKLMNALLENRSLAKSSEFLDQIAASAIEVDLLSRNATHCGDDLMIAAQLIQNMLTQPLEFSDSRLKTTLLASAHDYRKNSATSTSFCKVMIACVHYDKETQLLLDSLKLIAHDL